MKSIKFAASTAAKFFLAAFMAVVGVSCSDQLLETAAITGTQDIIESHDYDGYSVADITNKDGHFVLGFRIDLGKKKIETEADVTGKINAVKPSNPSTIEYSEKGMTGELMTRHFDFQYDGQTADATATWLVDSLADYHYEVTDVYYKDYTSNVLDDEGKVYQMLPHFVVNYIHTTDPTLNGELNLYPRYLHLTKGTEIVDSLIVRTQNNEGSASGSVTNVLGTGSSEVALTLGSRELTVEENQFGKTSLTNESNVTTEDISTTSQKGERAAKNFTFADGQTSRAIWQYLYQIAADNHVTITSVTYKDFTADKLSEDTYKITQHYEVNYQRVGTKVESGSFDLYPWYTQKLKKAENPTYVYEVDEKYSDSEANDVKMRNLSVKIYKKDAATGETVDSWRLRWTVVTSGHIVGRDTVYVSATNIVDHDFTDKEEMGEAYHYENKAIEDNPKFLETLSSHTYRCEAFAPADGGGKSVMGGQLLYQTSVITFTDENFIWKSKEFVKSVDRSDEQMYDDPSRAGKTCVSSDRTYKYGKSHKITAHNYLDGELWFSSTATSHLWVLQ